MRMSQCPHPYELQSYVDGALSREERARVQEHLLTCESCAARVGEMSRIHSLLEGRRTPPPAGLLERILEFVRTSIPIERLTCRQAVEMVSEYIDDELDSNERETLEAHLFACDDCFYEYIAMRTAAHAMREAPRVMPRAALKDRILAAVESEAVEAEPAVVGRITPVRPLWQRVMAPGLAVAHP